MASASSDAARNAPSTDPRSTVHQHRTSGSSNYSQVDSLCGESPQDPFQPIDDSSLLGFTVKESEPLPLASVSTNAYSVRSRSRSHQRTNAVPSLIPYEEIRRRQSPGQDELRPHDLILRDSHKSNENQAPRREGKHSTTNSELVPPPPPPHKHPLRQRISRKLVQQSPPKMGNAPLQAVKNIGKKKKEEALSSDDEAGPSSPGSQTKISNKAPALKLQFPEPENLNISKQPHLAETLRPVSGARSYQASDKTIRLQGQDALVASTETLTLLDTTSRQPRTTGLQEEVSTNDPLKSDRHTFPKRTHEREKSSTTLDFLNAKMKDRGIGDTATAPSLPEIEHQRSTTELEIDAILSATTRNIPTTSYKCPPPPNGFPIPPLNIVHFSCYQSHTNMTPSKNIHAPVPCVVCGVDDTEMRHKCTWCCLRICGACMDALDEFEKRDLKSLVLKRGFPEVLVE